MNRDVTGLAGARHEQYETLGSTNAEALSRARAGEGGPLWITTRTQTEGRGRRGSTWISPPGNLYATLLLSEPAEPAVAPQLSFVAGLAVCDAVAQLSPALSAQLKLKWPNDVLLEGGKLAGLLIEAENIPVFTVAIGIGINSAHHPAETPFPATDLREHGVTTTPDELFAVTAEKMALRLAQWKRGKGFPEVRLDWLARAGGLGQSIRVRLPQRELTGRFDGIDETGRLLVSSENRAAEAIAAGEVFGLRI